MASATGEDEYESDPEEEKRSLAMRRRQAASDDEEGDDRRAEVEEGSESDGQGGAEKYDEDEYEDEDDGEEYGDDCDEEEEEGEEGKVAEEVSAGFRDRDGDGDGGEVNGLGDGEGKEKKENEPFSVPTAGAFYMHDDRFRDNAAAGGRGGRRMRGGRRLWESRDDRKWGHDKFEEMTMQERSYVEKRRTSRGRYRGRGKSPGTGRGDMRENRPRAYNNVNDQQTHKSVRGRGPRRYERTGSNNKQALTTLSRQSGKSSEKNMRSSSATAFTPSSDVGSDQDLARKQVFASSLNSASPPFYPSGSSSKDLSMTQRDVRPASNTRNFRPDGIDGNITSAQNNTWMRGKDAVGVENLYIEDSLKRAAGKSVSNMQVQSSGASVATNFQSSESHLHGRGTVNTRQVSYQPAQHHNQVGRVSTSSSTHAQNRVQSPQQMSQHPGIRSQASSSLNLAPSVNSSEAGELESASESNKSKSDIVGKSSVQGSGRGSFLYSGGQLMGTAGNLGVGHGDQNFSTAPTFLPVMQFGGQHPGSMGVPAFGMAFPGYVGGNSEMTWLPVLAGGAGALGGAYCPPRISVDGSYHPRPAGLTSSVVSSNKESNTSKPNNEISTSQKDEGVVEDVGQRQNKPRRYSEMNFGQ